MHDFLHTYFAGSYALLASSSIETQAFETALGGYFTMVFHSITLNGLESETGRHDPFLTLENMSAALQDRLSKDGHPLSRCYIGPDLPRVPIAKNLRFRPATEKFVPYMKRIVEYVWNNDNPRTITTDELLTSVGKGAYANHSKLSLEPWGLLEDCSDNSTRRLTDKGILFARGEIAIPQLIIKDSITWGWIPEPNTKMIKYHEVRSRNA